MQWERDYVDYRKSLQKTGRGRGRSKSITRAQFGGGGICGCFGNNKDEYFQDDGEENRNATTRMAGYKNAKNQGFHHSIDIDAEINGEGQKKKKKKDKDGEEDGSEEKENNHLASIVDEAEIDDMYQEDFDVNGNNDVVLGHNRKKLKAVEMLLTACKAGK